ncbi:NOP protein chaperone 1 [Hemicordylus capensis]|uniref:NOP protein chaperone 1 n=1 Tax=Hemicordylus capensis TaxID=884348 RepID=UPI002302DDC0|nr:NOP protein chaperone 1 [Hemicordylus capensis]
MALKGDGACSVGSRDLLSVGVGGGFHETLLLNSKHAKKAAMRLQTVKVPRSNLLDRVQNFLPQMANANNELRREMESAPVQEFDIEHVDASTENVIEMNVALVELNGSDTEEEDAVSEDDSECEDSSACEEVTEDNIRLPKPKGEGRIEIVDSKTNE